MKMIDLYPAGEKIEIGSQTFTADEIIRFARKFDPQPFHTDPFAAKDYVFGALCASGWHTCAQWMRTFVDFWKTETARLDGAGIVAPKLGPSPGFQELQWLKPVYAGDTISYSVAMVESRALKTRPGLLLNTILCEGQNQNGETVLRFKSGVLEYDR